MADFVCQSTGHKKSALQGTLPEKRRSALAAKIHQTRLIAGQHPGIQSECVGKEDLGSGRRLRVVEIGEGNAQMPVAEGQYEQPKGVAAFIYPLQGEARELAGDRGEVIPLGHLVARAPLAQ